MPCVVGFGRSVCTDHAMLLRVRHGRPALPLQRRLHTQQSESGVSAHRTGRECACSLFCLLFLLVCASLCVLHVCEEYG